MNEIKVFEYESTKIRTVTIDGKPFFIAKDVCDILGIEKHRDAVSRLDDDERGLAVVDTLGGNQAVTAVNESGLYSLILTSRKPEAKVFKKWVTSEVLPSIRKTGSYTVPQNDDQLIVVGYEAAIRKIRLLEKKVETDAPKVESAEALIRCDKNMSVTDAAKHFGLHPRTQVYAFLRVKGFLTTRDLPTQDAIDAGLLTIRQNKINDTDFRPQVVVETAQLEKWRTWLVPRIVEWANEDISA